MPAQAIILAIAGQKGGIGKTTTTAALGGILAGRGDRVLLVDFDEQASLTTALGAPPQNDIGDLLRAQIAGADRPTLAEQVYPVMGGELDLLRSHLDLSVVESVDLMSPETTGRDQVLTNVLAGARGRYQWILIDCPPALGMLTVNALTAATAVVMPCTPEYLAVQGLGRLMLTIQKVRRNLNPRLRLAGILPTMVPFYGRNMPRHHAAMLDEMQRSAAAWQVPMLPLIPRLQAVVDSSGQGEPLSVYDPASPATEAYTAVVAALEESLHAR